MFILLIIYLTTCTTRLISGIFFFIKEGRRVSLVGFDLILHPTGAHIPGL